MDAVDGVRRRRVVAIAGGEPLTAPRDRRRSSKATVGAQEVRQSPCTSCAAARRRTRTCSNRRSYLFFSWSRTPTASQIMHDESVSPGGRATTSPCGRSDWARRPEGFTVDVDAAIVRGRDGRRGHGEHSLDRAMEALGVDGVSVSPGYADERVARRGITSSTRTQVRRKLFLRRRCWALGKGKKLGPARESGHVPGLPGRQPWPSTARRGATPTRNRRPGWQKPCYLLGEGRREVLQSVSMR